jgi:L-lactate utilization protein LutB
MEEKIGCDACRECPAYDTIGSRAELDEYLYLVSKLVKQGVLKITANNGDNVDYVEMEMYCKHCGREMRMVCEAYHGLGGRFENKK